jgi:hypothetical protein
VWTADDDKLRIPKTAQCFDRILRTAWPGYEIHQAITGLPELAKAAGVPHAEDYDSQLDSRPETVRYAAGLEDDDDDEDGSDEEDEDDECDAEGGFGDEPRAWLTIVDAGGAVRHRQLTILSQDLLGAADGVIEAATQLSATEVPPEKLVTEGMWIDQKKRQIGLWGGERTRTELPGCKAAWHGWSVDWANGGYEDHCRISGPSGVPMSEVESLAEILPTILSTKRFDLANVMGAVGGELKKTAMKATGCLLGIICFPVVLFGFFSGQWQAALITIGVVIALVVVIFKVVEFRFKRSFGAKLNPPDRENVAPVAGPLVEKDRRARIDQLLAASGFPPLAKIEPGFPKTDVSGLLE